MVCYPGSGESTGPGSWILWSVILDLVNLLVPVPGSSGSASSGFWLSQSWFLDLLVPVPGSGG